METGILFDVKELSVNDGPGLRTSVFLKGCPLRCIWCHNPEGLLPRPQLMESGAPCLGCGACRGGCGHADCRPFGRCLHVCPQGRLRVCGWREEAGALAARIREQESLLASSGGGVTLTGGEPLLQGGFLLALMAELKPLHVAVETSGCGDPDLFGEVARRADLLMVDLKQMDDGVHRRLTGAGNGPILSNLSRLMASGRPFIARIPLIPGVTDTPENLRETARFLSPARNLLRVELMPYNRLAGAKYASVGMEYRPEFGASHPPNIDGSPFEARGIEAVVL